MITTKLQSCRHIRSVVKDTDDRTHCYKCHQRWKLDKSNETWAWVEVQE